ncbi:type II toxin-antitoxin system RelE/ParE family toxin [Maribacter sp. 2304DJ31-5]|uniref:type II toxin-antitoxin system RelE/ParE family toxin n=1 Tax=Maribacter sp. 2304DJ31-5 TaxID=3386273 RepID=UPI0039BD151E
MKPKFEVVFLEQAIDFISKLDAKAKLENDPKLFKKLTDDIWEFRTLYQGIQYRLFAFWDKTDKSETLVLSTHGMVKKVSKVPKSEIDKALNIRTEYFNQ